MVAVIFVFIGRSLAANWDQLSNADLQLDVSLLVLSMVVLAAWMVGQASIWHFLTVASGTGIAFPKALAAWFYSQLGKYLPGKVFLYLGRLHFYLREGGSAGPVSLAFGVEMVGSFAASIITVLVSVLTLDVAGLNAYRPWLVVGLVALLVILHPRVLSRVITLAARIIRRRPFPVTVGYLQMLRFIGLYVLNWVVFGAALFLFIRSFYPIDASSILFLAGAFSFASMIGILAVFAPSGLGVREGILALFLRQVMPTSVALVASIAARIWLTAVELALVALVALSVRFHWIDVERLGSPRDRGGSPDRSVEEDL